MKISKLNTMRRKVLGGLAWFGERVASLGLCDLLQLWIFFGFWIFGTNIEFIQRAYLSQMSPGMHRQGTRSRPDLVLS